MLLFRILFFVSVLWFSEANVSTRCNSHGKRNEVYSQCANLECQNTCKNQNKAAGCSPLICVAGCVCEAGFIRNTLHDCVRPENCDIKSSNKLCNDPNEIYSTCGNNDCQRSCSKLDVSTCNPACSTPACVCREGFVRNGLGQCILPSECAIKLNDITCPGENQVYAPCGNDGCQRSCTRLDITNCNAVCSTPGCICASGFVRDGSGACIQPASCPSIVCTGQNEVFSPCGNNGCQRSCLRMDITNCILKCGDPGCICDVGFVRNPSGFCVIPTTCPGNPICTGANEVFSTCGNDGCQATCTTPTPAGCVSNCITGGGCICKAGFVRNAARECVAPSTCPITPTCAKENQVYTACGNDGCQPTCLRPTPLDCVGTCTRGGGCVCKPGFVTNAAGDCVAASTCPVILSCPGPSQVFSMCGDNGCQPTCTTPNPVACMSNCVAGGGCICAPGYLRNSLGACVTPEFCPTTCPGENQVFSACGEDGCRPSCARPNPTSCTGNCVTGGGCICQAGFVRDANQNCINPATCPVTCTAANEIFSTCGNNACQSTCATVAPAGCTGPCISGCICQPGYFRNSVGTCVVVANCPPPTCTGPNEMVSTCGEDGCQATCTRLTIPPNCVRTCNRPSCICVAGFVRNSAGTCVQPINCPPLTCTRAGEIFSYCGEDGCQRSCSTLSIGTCSPTCTTPGCICAFDLVRDSTGACIMPSNCPPICTRANEVYSMCGNDGCQRSCTRLDITGCISTCSTPGCVCDTGFVRNSNNDCVLPSTCPNTCPTNEVFSTCGNTNCQATCTQTAITPCPSPCTPGCVCNTGLLRNPAGVCVLPANCMDCGTRERFRACGPGECDSTCANPNLGTSPSCTTLGACTSRCFCRPGFVRNSAGVCVMQATCP